MVHPLNLQKFIPLAKMEEQADGTLHVYGIVTAEVPDAENEVCDYEGTKPYYKAKVEAMAKATSIPGMEPSIMPMREMHQLKAIGAGRSIDFDDAAKTIRMCFNVVEPDAIQKFRKGVLIGFSQGGAYVGSLTDDPVHKGCKRYTADPAEVSAVDSPCLPIALVESMKGRTVTLTKASGVTEEVHLEIKPLDSALLIKMDRFIDLMTKREFSHEEREHAASSGAALPDGSFPIENESDLKNAIHAFGRAKDKEKAKQHIIARAHALGLSHLIPEGWGAKVQADATISIETANGGGEDFSMAKITDQASLTKAAKTLHDHLEKHMEMHKALHEKMEGTLSKEHPIMKAHQSMMDHCEKCMKAAKDAGEGEEPEEAEKSTPPVELAKSPEFTALSAQVAELVKQNKELMEKMAKTPAPVLAHTGNIEFGKTSTATGFEDLIPATVTH